jgi:hypothetical protein
MAPHRLGYISLKRGGVRANTGLARRPNRRACAVHLLHHRTDETCELGDCPFQERFAEIEVAEDPIQRIGAVVVRRRLEKRSRNFGPMFRHSDRKRFFALEVVKERTLGHPRVNAELLNRGRRIAFLADERKGRIQ